jgi:hypothetical protein
VAAASPDPTTPSGAGTLDRRGKRRPPDPATQAPSPSTSPPQPQTSSKPVVAASDSNPPPGQGGTPPGQLKKGAGDAGRSGERRGEPKH